LLIVITGGGTRLVIAGNDPAHEDGCRKPPRSTHAAGEKPIKKAAGTKVIGPCSSGIIAMSVFQKPGRTPAVIGGFSLNAEAPLLRPLGSCH